MKLFQKGSRVLQSQYGSGTVTSSDDRYTVIEFDNHGRRTFITEMVSLGLTTEPAPARRAKSKAKPKTEKAADKTVEKVEKVEKPEKAAKKTKKK